MQNDKILTATSSAHTHIQSLFHTHIHTHKLYLAKRPSREEMIVTATSSTHEPTIYLLHTPTPTHMHTSRILQKERAHAQSLSLTHTHTYTHTHTHTRCTLRNDHHDRILMKTSRVKIMLNTSSITKMNSYLKCV